MVISENSNSSLNNCDNISDLAFSSYGCLLKNNGFSPRRLNFKKKVTNISSWYSDYSNYKLSGKEYSFKLHKVLKYSGYEHVNSGSLKATANGSWLFPLKSEKSIFNDSLARDSFFNMLKFDYTRRAKAFFYDKRIYSAVYSKAFPYIISDKSIFKKRIALRLLQSGSKKKKVKIFFRSLRSDLQKIELTQLSDSSLKSARFKQLKYAKFAKSCVKDLFWKGLFPAITLVKKTLNVNLFSGYLKMTFLELLSYQQFRRHPSSQNLLIRKNLKIGTDMDSFFSVDLDSVEKIDHSRFYKIYWKYFKFKVEKFFYNQINTRVHIWFLNIWDIFLNSIDALWRWFRYENKAIYFLTKKGQRFLIEDREDAKFYLRALTLTITMVGGAKLFMDKVSIMMRRYRNNWAFILHTVKTLRMSINYFWFRFFVNYKITLQGKIGGFLRAQKKIFKKGNVSIENKESAITYYRGFPVTRFGSYNLSFWLQYRIPNLIKKFGDSTYIDTMQVLLSLYSVPWLASRLYEIIKKMLMERVYVVNRKLTQYDRRSESRQTLIYDVLKIKKYYYKYSNVKPGNIHRYKKLRDVVLKKRVKGLFAKPFRRKIVKNLAKFNSKSTAGSKSFVVKNFEKSGKKKIVSEPVVLKKKNKMFGGGKSWNAKNVNRPVGGKFKSKASFSKKNKIKQNTAAQGVVKNTTNRASTGNSKTPNTAMRASGSQKPARSAK